MICWQVKFSSGPPSRTSEVIEPGLGSMALGYNDAGMFRVVGGVSPFARGV
jgi:hypothetical protein